jgi:hypothetical protein
MRCDFSIRDTRPNHDHHLQSHAATIHIHKFSLPISINLPNNHPIIHTNQWPLIRVNHTSISRQPLTNHRRLPNQYSMNPLISAMTTMISILQTFPSTPFKTLFNIRRNHHSPLEAITVVIVIAIVTVEVLAHIHPISSDLIPYNYITSHPIPSHPITPHPYAIRW